MVETKKVLLLFKLKSARKQYKDGDKSSRKEEKINNFKLILIWIRGNNVKNINVKNSF